ncbi:hypothetical protein [Candidatus Hamiltonella defensa]|nr:hypothetical protein [Candidatus Hamiltonella defensa]
MEEESNPWPSFVDTFSSMLCIFIFIMLIFLLNNMLVVYESAIGGEGKVIYQKQSDSIELQQENSLNTLNKTEVEDSIQKIQPGIENGHVNTAQDKVLVNKKNTQNELSQIQIENENIVKGVPKQVKNRNNDIAHNKDKTRVTITGNTLTIEYEGEVNTYLQEDITKMMNWIKSTKKNSFEIEIFIPKSKISFSDSLRLAYEKGLILMREIKSVDPSLMLNININTNSDSLENKVVIVPKN